MMTKLISFITATDTITHPPEGGLPETQLANVEARIFMHFSVITLHTLWIAWDCSRVVE